MKTIQQCKSGKELLHYAEHHGGQLAGGHGSHRIVETPQGKVPIPVHGNHDLHVGIRCKIIKELAAIGITVFLFGTALWWMLL